MTGRRDRREAPEDRRASLDLDIAAAYSSVGVAWRDGPARVYTRMAQVLVDHCPVAVDGAAVVDIGAGTGAATAAARAAGARTIVAVDVARGMLTVDASARPPSALGDAVRLPFRTGSFDVALASFSFNHLADPAAGFLEGSRVVRTGGAIVAASYASDDTHPVKGAVERAMQRRGWAPPAWQHEMHERRVPLLATIDACRATAESAGLEADVTAVRVDCPELGPAQLVEWRLGMAHTAPFVAALDPAERERLRTDAVAELGDHPPPLVRSILVTAAYV